MGIYFQHYTMPEIGSLFFLFGKFNFLFFSKFLTEMKGDYSLLL